MECEAAEAALLGVGEEGLGGEGGAEVEVGRALVLGLSGKEIEGDGVAGFGEVRTVEVADACGELGFKDFGVVLEGVGGLLFLVGDLLLTSEGVRLLRVEGEGALIGGEGGAGVVAGFGGAGLVEEGFDPLRLVIGRWDGRLRRPSDVGGRLFGLAVRALAVVCGGLPVVAVFWMAEVVGFDAVAASVIACWSLPAGSPGPFALTVLAKV